ncbi:hypothetical protein UMZ34_14660 [Halopseudomonas pachastrellae]|nr:hypothetical protein UMZ34_14660 [Halopseudomonas pachastrellae]
MATQQRQQRKGALVKGKERHAVHSHYGEHLPVDRQQRDTGLQG